MRLFVFCMVMGLILSVVAPIIIIKYVINTRFENPSITVNITDYTMYNDTYANYTYQYINSTDEYYVILPYKEVDVYGFTTWYIDKNNGVITWDKYSDMRLYEFSLFMAIFCAVCLFAIFIIILCIYTTEPDYNRRFYVRV